MTEKEIGERDTLGVSVRVLDWFILSETNHRYRPCYYIEREVLWFADWGKAMDIQKIRDYRETMRLYMRLMICKDKVSLTELAR